MSNDTTPPSAAVLKRRDFLAGAATVALAAPMIPRAAFAQAARSGPPADTVIVRAAIFPALGMSRVGNSPEWFLAPEVPGLPPVAGGSYKDGNQAVRKQVQRFRVYGFNAAGEVVGEITAADSRITWTVHVANTKGAWYGFNNPLDNGDLAPGLPGLPRNQAVVGTAERARMLVIDPGARQITGTAVNADGGDPAYRMVGRFWNALPVTLGALGTDEAGRLLVFPGDGLSQSAIPNNPITNFSDNDGWHDDWCDGPVNATVVLADGRTLAADNAWIACCGPDFAPEIPPFVSMYDVMTDVAVDAGWLAPPSTPLSFRRDVYPFFRRIALMEWVAQAANLERRWVGVGDFSDPAYVAKLADPAPANEPFRRGILATFRNPDPDPSAGIAEQQQQYALPYMLGDGINYNASVLKWLRIPKQQYAILQAWAAGLFVDDLGDPAAPETVDALEDLPLAEQPHALTRAAMEPCSGGAFHPGVELTWPLRHRELYAGPYRVARSAQRDPSLVQDLGLLLTPEVAFAGYRETPPAIGPQMPGDLTRWMGLPWQCDAFSCQYVMFSNDFPNATWWPALLPIDVLPQVYYDAVMDPTLSKAERMRFFENRVLWSRGVPGIGYHANASYTDGLNRMLYLWDRMGFVVSRPGPTDPDRPAEIPSTLFVEVDRGSMDLTLDQQPYQASVPPLIR